MTTISCTVLGMVCSHCAQSVTDEVKRIPGVTEVDVDLGANRVTVTGDRTLDQATVRRAIEAAGYELADAAPAQARAR